MARSIWKGSIAFGLVQIPVDLHVAEAPDELSFRQLDKHDFAPIGYDRVNKRTGKKVAWDDIVRGFEWDKGEYIVSFVDAGEIDAIYFEKPYYLKPTKQGAKAYALLRRTLERTKQIGVAKIVIRTRQHLAVLVARGDALVLVTMRYAHELRGDKELELPHDATGITEAEQKMADTLVHGMHAKSKPEDYKDEFRDDVLALVEKKAKAGEVNTVEELEHEPHHETPRKGNVVDLMELLKKSIESHPPSVKSTKPKSRRKSA